MKNLKLISTSLLFVLLSMGQSVFGQELNPEEDIFIRQLNENQFGVPQPGGLFSNQAILTQMGTFNSGNITQQNTGNFQRENLGIIIQAGNYNESTLTQTGSGNQSISTQIGNRNSSNLILDGDFNTTATLKLAIIIPSKKP